MISSTLEIIEQLARVPSFSSYEERIHPLVESIAARHPSARIEKIPENNILIEAPGNPALPPVAIAAHLDKINHFGAEYPAQLDFEKSETKIKGLLDDAAGAGLALSLLLQSAEQNFPPLQILLSEMEEATDLRNRPDLMKNGGARLHSGIGAERLARHLIQTNRAPALAITIDVTPKFRGAPGVAIYYKHWEFNGMTPTDELVAATEKVRDQILTLDPEISVHNNTNDYLVYGKVFNEESGQTVPSIAIEPAIWPYHQADEEIFIEDLERIETTLRRLMNSITRFTK